MDILLDLCIHLIKSLHKAFLKCPFKKEILKCDLDKPSAFHIQVERSNLYCQLSQLATAGDSLLVLGATLAACQWELEVKQKYFSSKVKPSVPLFVHLIWNCCCCSTHANLFLAAARLQVAPIISFSSWRIARGMNKVLEMLAIQLPCKAVIQVGW